MKNKLYFVFLFIGLTFAENIQSQGFAIYNYTTDIKHTDIVSSNSFISKAISQEDESNFYFEKKFSNKNFTYHSRSLLDKRREYTYNYNRFRIDLDFGWEDKVTFKVIGDVENYLGRSFLTSPDSHLTRIVSYNMPLDPYHYVVSENEQVVRTYLYRAYATVYLPSSSLRIGYQRAAFGVGRIWNPTDILNPSNPLSVEPGERIGVYGLSYTYDISSLSQLQTIMTLDRYNNTLDSGARFRTNFSGIDLGLSAIRNKNLRMSGLEIEREWFSTGLGFRTEACFLENRIIDKDYYVYMVGVDYAFENSLYLVIEHLFNGGGAQYIEKYNLFQTSVPGWNQLARHYLGVTVGYEITPLIYLSIAEIQNLNDGSYFAGPAVQWSLEEDLDLSFGATFFAGQPYSEFSYLKDIYYLSCDWYF